MLDALQGVSRHLLCNAVENCVAGSDERGCIEACADSELQCGDGACVVQAAMCDGTFDCIDRSDELGCVDGIPECMDPGAGECGPQACADDEMRCDDGACIPQDWLCDGEIQDGQAGEDEDAD